MNAYIPTAGAVRTVTDMRERAVRLLREVKEQGPLYIFRRSKPEAVILSMEEYQKVLEVIDEHYLSFKAQEYEKIDPKNEEWLTLKEFVQSLNLKSSK